MEGTVTGNYYSTSLAEGSSGQSIVGLKGKVNRHRPGFLRPGRVFGLLFVSIFLGSNVKKNEDCGNSEEHGDRNNPRGNKT